MNENSGGGKVRAMGMVGTRCTGVMGGKKDQVGLVISKQVGLLSTTLHGLRKPF